MTTPPQHLLIQAHGLFGNIDNWKVINEHFKDVIDTEQYLLHPSEVNQYKKTFEGIDVCGERLANEIKDVVKAHPSLNYISMLGHSMGGLLIRYAAGKLFDPDGRTIAGLEPIHFICMATPHLGCDSSGEGQVPIVGWMFPVKVSAGGRVDRFVSNVSRRMFSTAGSQLFLNDTAPAVSQTSEDRKPPDEREIAPINAASTAKDHHPPLIAKLAFDVPNEGLYLSALQSFKTRTCYGNAANDHIVGWANSTLRYADELPDVGLKDRDRKIIGVVHEEPIENAWLRPDEVEQLLPVRRNSAGKTSYSGSAGGSKKLNRTESKLKAALIGATGSGAQSPRSRASSNGDAEGSPVEDLAGVEVSHADIAAAAMKVKLQDTVDLPRAAVAAVVLERLRCNTSWSRVDCAWRDSRFPMFAHNLIQVTREWLNSDGKPVCAHLARRFGELEEYVRSNREVY